MKYLPILCLLAAAAGVRAQAVQDPTRPPARFIKPVAGAAATGAPQLQSILIGRGANGRKVAVIDGAMVRVGDLVQGARVTGMTQHAVQLARGGMRETLTLGEPAAATPAAAAGAVSTAPVTAAGAVTTAPVTAAGAVTTAPVTVAPVTAPPVAPASKPE